MSERSERRRPRRRRWRRLLLRGFALLTIVTIVVFFARDEIIELLVPGIISSSLGLELSIESVETSIDGKVVVRGVRSQNPEPWAIVRELEVERVEAQLSPGRFFRGGLPLTSVRAEGLRIEIDTTRPGPPEDRPSEAKADGESFRFPESWPELEATDAQVVLRTGALDAAFDDLGVKLDRSETGNALAARGVAQWSLGERSGSFPFGLSAGYRSGIVSRASLELSGEETLREGRIDLAALDLQATLVTRNGEATIELEGLRTDETVFRAQAKSFDLAELPPRVGLDTQPLRGIVSLEAEAELDRDDWIDSTLVVAGRLRDAAWQGRPIPDASFDVEYADRIATASPLEVEDEFTTIVARSLRFRLGQKVEPLDGALQIVSRDLAATFAAFLPEIPAVEELGSPSLEASLAVEGKSIVIESIELETALAKVEASEGRIAEIDLRSAGGLPFSATGRVRASVPSLAAWRELLAERGVELDPAGSLVVDAEVNARRESFAVDGIVEGTALAIGDLPIGDLQAQASFENDRLDVRSFRLQGTDPAPLFVELSGSLAESGRADGSPQVDLDLAVRGEELRRRLVRLVPQFEEEIPDGAFAGRVQLSGDPRWPDVELGIDVFPAETPADRPLRPLGIRLAKRGDAFNVDLRNVSAAGVRISTIVSADVTPDLSRAAGTIESLLVIYEGEPWSSVQRSEFRFDQTARTMMLDPPLELTGPRREELGIGLKERPDVPGGRELVFFARAPNRVPIPAPEELLRAYGLDAHARLVYDRSPWLEAASWVPVEANARIGLRYTRLKRDELVLDVRRAAIVADWDESAPDSIVLLDVAEIDVGRLGEEAEDVARAVLGGTISEWIVSNAVLESRIRVNGPELSLDRLTLAGTGIQATAAGRVSLENDGVRDLIASGLSTTGTIDLAANGRIDSLEILQPLVPAARRLEGRWWSLATVRGTLSEPSIYARFALEEGRMRAEGAPGLDSVTMAGAFRDGTLTIGSLQTEIGGAPLDADGRVKWLGDDPPQADFRARGRNVLFVRSDNARIRGDVDLAVTGGLDSLAVEGSVDLTEGRVLGEVPLFDVLRTTARRLRGAASRAFERRPDQAAQRAASLRLFSFGAPPLSEVRFDVEVNTKKRLELRGNLVRGYLRPEVRLLGTGRVPKLAGVVYLEEFTIELPATRLRVESGLIRFDERQALRPELELKAETRMLGYDIDVAVTGPVDDTTITLSSSPPLPSDDLFVLLVTGQLPETAGAEARQAALFTVAKYIGLDLIRQLFGGESIEDEESIIDRFEIEMGRDVSATGRETLEVRFRLIEDAIFDEDTLYLVGERDKYDDYNAGLRIVIRGE